VAHMGLTTSGTIGARTARSLDDCVRDVAAIVKAGKSVRDDLFVLCHGGPIANPDDARYLLDRVPGLDGFYGASSMERLPTEVAITQQTREFAGLRLSRLAPESAREEAPGAG
jgi:predicted TIM-barrel enzyme